MIAPRRPDGPAWLPAWTWLGWTIAHWIKPSFSWMMYRSGWATKPCQEHVLAIRIPRDGFDWALANAALNSNEPGVHTDRRAWRESLRSPVRVQWDPEMDNRCRTGRSGSA